MDIKQVIASVAIVSAIAPAFAEEWVSFSDVVSTKSRAEVVDELKQAQMDGSLISAQSEYVVLAPATGTMRSREEVRAEAVQSARIRGSSVNDIYFGG